jgi:hypothetical protein
MIKFALSCDGGHEFESWFQNGGAYEAQSKSGLIHCPICQTPRVAKAIMAPALAYHGRNEDVPAPAVPVEPSTKVALIDDRDRELRTLIEDVRKRILEHTDNVGARFADEARRIHDGLAPDRAIHGQATSEEARALIEEGIAILPIPQLPGEFN